MAVATELPQAYYKEVLQTRFGKDKKKFRVSYSPPQFIIVASCPRIEKDAGGGNVKRCNRKAKWIGQAEDKTVHRCTCGKLFSAAMPEDAPSGE